MTDTEITALARGYAEEVYRNAHKEMEVLPNCLSNEAINMFAGDMENKLKWLLRRFCLVEKSKLEEEYKSSKHYFEHTDSSNPTQKQYFWGRMCAIESLFPEIAKEVEL